MQVVIIQDDVGPLILRVPVKDFSKWEPHWSSYHSAGHDHDFLGTVKPLVFIHMLPGTVCRNIGQILPLLKD